MNHGRIADVMQGNQVTFGGLGFRAWNLENQQQKPSLHPEVFSVNSDRENQPPPYQQHQFDPRTRNKTLAPAAGGKTIYNNQENQLSLAAGKTVLGVRVASRSQRAPLTAVGNGGLQVRPSRTTSIAPFTIHTDNAENQPTPGTVVTGKRSQQRKQKLKQRTLQDLQNGKRPSLRSKRSCESTATSETAPFSIFIDQTTASLASTAPPSLSAPFVVLDECSSRSVVPAPAPLSAAHKENASAWTTVNDEAAELSSIQHPCDALPAAPLQLQTLSSRRGPRRHLPDSSGPAVVTPNSLHSSFENISIVGSGRRSANDAIYAFQEYAADLYRVMRDSELRHRAKPGFMSRQPDITLTMRTILVDWLVEVNDEYKMTSETMHLAVNYIDRFLSVMTVVRSKLQLVGTTALFIASKFEEIYPPTAVEFVYITDDTYTAPQLKRMEHVMLKMLAFDISVPTSWWFLNYYCCYAGIPHDSLVKHLAQYVIELSLVQYEVCNRYLCSQQAAAAISLALQTNDDQPWNSLLTHVTGYSLSDLRPCIEEMLVVLQMARTQPQQAVVEKFSQDKYSGVSSVEPPARVCWQ